MHRIGIATLILILLAVTAQARSLEEIRKSHEVRFCIAGERSDFHETIGLTFARYIVPGGKATVLKLPVWEMQFVDDRNVVRKKAAYTPKYMGNDRCDFYPNNIRAEKWMTNKVTLAKFYPTRLLVMIPRTEYSPVRSLGNMAGRTVALDRETPAYEWFVEQNQSAFSHSPMIPSFMKPLEALLSVANGTVDCAVVSVETAFRNKEKVYNAVPSFPVGKAGQAAWAFPIGEKELVVKFREFLEKQRQDKNSDLNRAWSNEYGVTLTSFLSFINTIMNR